MLESLATTRTTLSSDDCLLRPGVEPRRVMHRPRNHPVLFWWLLAC